VVNQEKQERIHIPCGFRCSTKARFRITQASLPFDSGFFSPESIIRFLNAEKIEINMENTTPCIKTEKYMENNIAGIKFEESNYDHINMIINKRGYDNNYLDITRGYYTLCKDYGFVLAHYNWHALSDTEKNKGITEPEENINIINNTLTKRKHRLLEWIDNAKEINLYFHSQASLFHETHPMFMRVNKNKYDLCDPRSKLLNYFQNKYKDKSCSWVSCNQKL
jgi:hypothetical protein